MPKNISNFLMEIIKGSNNLEILLSLLKEEKNLELITSLSDKLKLLTYTDKEMIAKTFNTLNLVKNARDTEKKEQEHLIKLLNIYVDLLITANPFQKDNLIKLLAGLKLNGKQQLAVIVKDGSMLLSAGPGSGKTRTMMYKIGVLVDVYNEDPSSILAVTFTNKSANEMKTRIRDLIGKKASQLNMATFHSICTGFLRNHISELPGYAVNFTIADDSTSEVKLILERFKLEKIYAPREVSTYISDCKNRLLTPEDVIHDSSCPAEYPAIYAEYQKRLKRNNTVDYDDMIMLTVQILSSSDEIRDKYRKLYKFILIDEYQDTNLAQYTLCRLICPENGNITVVGDPDQSVYKFRGADIRNILNFIRDYPSCISINLDTNYRSTKTIVRASASVISLNKERIVKTINPFEGNAEGELIQVHTFFDIQQESSFVSTTIKKLIAEHKYEFKDFMVLYRNNSLSRAVEEAFLKTGIPYTLVGGLSFYKREEIQDIMAYLKLSVNLQDSTAFTRIYNRPARKISETVFEIIQNVSQISNVSYFQASLRINNINQAYFKAKSPIELLKKEDKDNIYITDCKIKPQFEPFLLNENQFQSLNQFLVFMKKIFDFSATATAYDTLKFIISETKYMNYLDMSHKKEPQIAIDKRSNVNELLNASIEYKENFEVIKDSASEFINYISLIQSSNTRTKFDFASITSLNNLTFNIKIDDKKENLISFFGEYENKSLGLYDFDISKSIILDLTSKMKEGIECLRTGNNYSNTLPNLHFDINSTDFRFSYKEIKFIFNHDQMNKIFEYLNSITNEHTVNLMTMHSAKGLERKVIFIIGTEQGTTPSLMSSNDIEEERRLFFVGMTRAENLLYLTNCEKRVVFGKPNFPKPSQFISEIPSVYLYKEKH